MVEAGRRWAADSAKLGLPFGLAAGQQEQGARALEPRVEAFPVGERLGDGVEVTLQAASGTGQAGRGPRVFGRQRLEPGEAFGGAREAGDDRQLGPGGPGVPLPPALGKGRVGPLDQG